ncbi:MAG: RNA polymerase sigma factor [bacterium]
MLLAIVKSLFGRKSDQKPYEEQSDEELMLGYADGDARAFEVLLRRHEKPVFNFIYRSVGRKDIAEELLQDVFLRVIRNASSYQQSAKFTTWLYTIARNICIDRSRKKGGKELSLDQPVGDDDKSTFLDQVVDGSSQMATDYDRDVFRQRLEQALAKLPDEQREVFVMREISDLKFREIAEILDIPVPTVKSRMRYALEALRGHLSEYADHSFDDEDERVNSPASG